MVNATRCTACFFNQDTKVMRKGYYVQTRGVDRGSLAVKDAADGLKPVSVVEVRDTNLFEELGRVDVLRAGGISIVGGG